MEVVDYCIFCGKTEIKEFRRISSCNRNEVYVQCQECGLLWVSPREPEKEQLAAYNSDWWLKAECHAAYWNRELHCKSLLSDAHFVTKHMQEPGRVLDVGCASGFFLELLQERGWEVIGCDVSRALVEFGKETTGLNLIHGKIEDVELPPSSLDLITAIDVIEHLRDPRIFAEYAAKLLKKKGGLYIRTPIQDCPAFKREKENWGYLPPHEHLFCFSKDNLETLLGRVGFKLVSERLYEEGGLYWFSKE